MPALRHGKLIAFRTSDRLRESAKWWRATVYGSNILGRSYVAAREMRLLGLNVTRGCHAKQPRILTAELRCALIADSIACSGDVSSCNDQPASLLQSQAFLVLQRAHRGGCTEVAMERGRAHACRLRQGLAADRLIELIADHRDRATHLREPAIRPCDLTDDSSLRALHQSVEDLAFVKRRKRGDILRRVYLAKEAWPRVEQIGCDRIDGEGWLGRGKSRLDVRQHRRQSLAVEVEADRQIALIRQSWTPRTVSPWSGQAYGYGWFLTDMRGHAVRFAWGYGGQMVYVIPDLQLTIVMTSDPNGTRDTGHIDALHRLVADLLIPAAERGA